MESLTSRMTTGLLFKTTEYEDGFLYTTPDVVVTLEKDDPVVAVVKLAWASFTSVEQSQLGTSTCGSLDRNRPLFKSVLGY